MHYPVRTFRLTEGADAKGADAGGVDAGEEATQAAAHYLRNTVGSARTRVVRFE